MRGLWLMSASSDRTRVVLKSDTSHSDIYVARFDERQGRLLDTPRRLTTDERGGFPGAWTPDGETILFNLGQSGSQDIFTQSRNAESAEPLVVGPGNQVLPRMSSDGRWVLFQSPPSRRGSQGWRVMRVPLGGGRPEQVFATDGFAFPRCALRGRCVLFERDKDRWIISSLRPSARQRGAAVFDTVKRGGRGRFTGRKRRGSLLEGSRPTNRIRIYSLHGEPHKEVVVKNATALVNLDWAATGAGFFSSNRSPGNRSELLFIRLDGTSHVLWSQQGTSGAPVAAIPSPDGTHLAIAGWTRQSNAWMLTGF